MIDDTYHGTRGHSGGAASREAAEADLLNGVTNRLQLDVLRIAEDRGRRGVTASEAREHLQEHHGRVSSALTKMHIAGHLVALTERRGHGGIYVTRDNVDGREVRPYRRQNPRPDRDELAQILGEHEHWRGYDQQCQCGADSGNRTAHRLHVADVILARLRGEETAS
jgi:hypothetical protein